MEIPVSYLTKYASPEQLTALRMIEARGWQATHLFTLRERPGRVLVWCIIRAVPTEHQPRHEYAHMWIDRDGKLNRYPAHLWSRTT